MTLQKFNETELKISSKDFSLGCFYEMKNVDVPDGEVRHHLLGCDGSFFGWIKSCEII